jgi:hypothetical protein
MPSGTPVPAEALIGATINATAAQLKKSPYFIVKPFPSFLIKRLTIWASRSFAPVSLVASASNRSSKWEPKPFG